MVSRVIDLLNPYFWLFLSGVFMGGGFGRFPFLYRREHRQRELDSKGWLSISFAFSLAVIFAAAAVFSTAGGIFSGQSVDLSFLRGEDWLILLAISFLIGFLARRFPFSAGIPLFILTGSVILFSSLALNSWESYKPNEEILRIRILAEKDNSVLKFTFPPGKELISTIEGVGILPVVERIDFSPAFFFLGRGKLYRINRLTAVGLSEPLPFHSPYTRNFFWGEILKKGALKLPFLDYREDSPSTEPPALNDSFILFFDEEGQLHFNSILGF